MKFIDTHAHLYDAKYKNNLAEIIATCQATGIEKIYLPNIDSSTIEPMIALEKSAPLLFKSMLGLHPCSVGKNYQQVLAKIAEWLPKHNFVAIGEVGIDKHWDQTYVNTQLKVLETCIGWAATYNLPLSLHTRSAIDMTIERLQAHGEKNLKGVFHCFNGTITQMEKIMALGFYVGIGGLVTFGGNALAKMVQATPLQKMVLETDSPYLAPHPHRGKTNSPHYLTHIAQKIAEIKGISLHRVAEVTTENAQQLFESNRKK
ncbi:MAG: TatD family hydrolase [Cytophagales bacterium]